MARYPGLSGPAQALPASVFEKLMRRLATYQGRVIPLHMGDTHLAPPVKSRLGALGFTSEPDADMYRYSPPPGKQKLLEAIAEKVHRENGLSTAGPDAVQVSSGATHALSCAVRSVVDAGEHMLLLAPYWPLIRGIALSAGVRPIDVPFSQVLLRDPDADPEALIERFVTPETTAIYLCTPNNPDGKVFGERELGAIARVARRHDLWVLSDEVYEHFLYDGRTHRSIGTLEGMAERTFTAFSFSKSYGQAGLRVGYVVAPPPAIAAVRKMSNHTVYCVPRAMQLAALMALQHGDEFLAEARAAYQSARDFAHGKLSDLALLPEGSSYLWLDLSRYLGAGDDSAFDLLERMAAEGVLLAPGGAFGHEFGRWARLCFTSVTRESLEEGVDRVRRVLDRT
ncbi:MAG TPA: pyridoxal phosphate-dependent aminotransferase [Kofleriaceae bacterium]|nr:pyridoxal phosphate-dependent aminotransferase [Kofleriaceae bacterium]